MENYTTEENFGTVPETPTKENSYLDLTLLSEEEKQQIKQITGENVHYHKFIHFHNNKKIWWTFDTWSEKHTTKKEINFSQFKEMMGSEGKAEAEKPISGEYQPLFDHLNSEHGLILVESEMDEIIRIVHKL